jgi:hypothetical protein
VPVQDTRDRAPGRSEKGKGVDAVYSLKALIVGDDILWIVWRSGIPTQSQGRTLKYHPSMKSRSPSRWNPLCGVLSFRTSVSATFAFCENAGVCTTFGGSLTDGGLSVITEGGTRGEPLKARSILKELVLEQEEARTGSVRIMNGSRCTVAEQMYWLLRRLVLSYSMISHYKHSVATQNRGCSLVS